MTTRSQDSHLTSQLLLIAMMAVLVSPFVLTTVYAPDEFTNLNNGLRQLQGQVIYKDFFEFTAPISHWLPAGLFALTGPSLLAARLVQAALLLFTGWLAYRLARRLEVGPWAAMLPGLLLVASLYRFLPGYSHHWMALPFVLAALCFALRGLDQGLGRWWLMAGASVGLTLLTMQSDGGVLAIALAGWLVFGGLLGGIAWRAAAKAAAWMLLGAVLPLAAAAGYFLSQGALYEAWYQMWVWPMVQYKQAGGINDVKYLTDVWTRIATNTHEWTNLPTYYARFYQVLGLAALLPLSALAAAAWGLGLLWRGLAYGRPLTRPETRLGLLGLLVIGFALLATRGRADLPHAAFYALPAVVFATVAAQRWKKGLTAPEHVVLRSLPQLGLVLLLVTGVAWLGSDMRRHPDLWLRLESPDERLRRAPLLQYLEAHTSPQDRLISLPGGAMHYFYGRPAASRFTLMLPPEYGYNSEAEFQACLEEIRENRPKYVLISPISPRKDSLRTLLEEGFPGYRKVPDAFTTPSGPLNHPTYLFERVAP